MSFLKTILLIWKHPFNRMHRLRAVSRFLRWQIASRLLYEFVFGFPFANKTRLFMSNGMTGATGNWYCGLHEYDEMSFVLHVLKKGDIFIDIGANIGSYTVLACSCGAQVISVEPVPDTFNHLIDNINLNRFNSQVQVQCMGLSESPSTLYFTSHLDTMNHVVANESRNDLISVPFTTLDDLVKDSLPVIIKIDVEGYEWPVLKGAKKTLEKQSLIAMLIETNGSGERYDFKDSSIFEIMKKNGFDAYSYNGLQREVTPYKKGQLNTIFIRNKQEVLSRILTSKSRNH